MFSAKDYLNPLIFMGRKLLSEAKIKVGKMAIFDHKVEILPFGTTLHCTFKKIYFREMHKSNVQQQLQ